MQEHPQRMPWTNSSSARAPGTRATCTSAQRGFLCLTAPSQYPGNRVNALGAVQGCGEGGTPPALTVPEQKCFTGSTCKCIKQEPPLSTLPQPCSPSCVPSKAQDHASHPPISLQCCVTQGRRKEAFLYVRGNWKVLRAEIISGGGLRKCSKSF